MVSGFGFRVPGIGFRVPSSGFQVSGSVFRVPCSGFWVPGSGFRVPALGLVVWDILVVEDGGHGENEWGEALVELQGTLYATPLKLKHYTVHPDTLKATPCQQHPTPLNLNPAPLPLPYPHTVSACSVFRGPGVG